MSAFVGMPDGSHWIRDELDGAAGEPATWGWRWQSDCWRPARASCWNRRNRPHSTYAERMTSPEGRASVCACIIVRDEQERLPRRARQRRVLRRADRRRLRLARPHRGDRRGGRCPGDPQPVAGLRRPAQRGDRAGQRGLDPGGRRRRARHAGAAAGDRGVPLADVPDGVDICGVPCRGPAAGRPPGALGEVPQVPAAAVPAGPLLARRGRGGARGPVGLQADCWSEFR